jgi:hypothetical protein
MNNYTDIKENLTERKLMTEADKDYDKGFKLDHI